MKNMQKKRLLQSSEKSILNILIKKKQHDYEYKVYYTQIYLYNVLLTKNFKKHNLIIKSKLKIDIKIK